MRAMSIGWVALASVLVAVSGGALSDAAYAAAADPPLVSAAEAGDVAAVRELLAGGVDVDAASVDGATALHWAAHRDLPGLVRLLIDFGADVSATNRYGVQPIALAATNGSAVVLDQLLTAGADPNASMPGGETALMTAARAGPPDAVRVLLRAGANPNARDDLSGQTAVMWAAARNNAPAVHALAELGTDLHARTAGPPPAPSRSYFRSPAADVFHGPALRGSGGRHRCGTRAPRQPAPTSTTPFRTDRVRWWLPLPTRTGSWPTTCSTAAPIRICPTPAGTRCTRRCARAARTPAAGSPGPFRPAASTASTSSTSSSPRASTSTPG